MSSSTKRVRQSTPPLPPSFRPLGSSPPAPKPCTRLPSSPTKRLRTPAAPARPPPSESESEDEIEDFSSDDDGKGKGKGRQRDPSPTPVRRQPGTGKQRAKLVLHKLDLESESEVNQDEIEDPDSPPSSPTKPFRRFGPPAAREVPKPVPVLRDPRKKPLAPPPARSQRPTPTLVQPPTPLAPASFTPFSNGRAIALSPGEPWIADPRCSPAQLAALDAVRRGDNVFLTGPAGTGKSFLLHQIRALLSSLNRELWVTATTGIAALSVDGITLHSFAGVGLGTAHVERLVGMVRGRKGRLENWTKGEVLVVDEVSMLHPDLFTKLSMVGKLVREDRRAFGGLQLIVCGDFFQLPPVPDRDPSCIRCGKQDFISIPESESRLSCSPHHSSVRQCTSCKFESRPLSFAFETDAWAECAFTPIALTHVLRQSDPVLISTLASLRHGTCSAADASLITSGGSLVRSDQPSTKLYPKRKDVDALNRNVFGRLPGESRTFVAKDGTKGPRGPEFLREALAPSGRLADFRAARAVDLKPGAQVMLLTNLDPGAKLANGSLGRVLRWEEVARDLRVKGGEWGSMEWAAQKAEEWLEGQKSGRWLPVVEFDCGVVRMIGAHSWTIEVDGEKELVRTQLPLQLAWALTIHKSQGQTIQRVRVHLDGTFEAGQAYVALSRATSLAGLLVVGFDKSLVKAHPLVTTFYKTLEAGPSSSSPSPSVYINPLDFLQPSGNLYEQKKRLFGPVVSRRGRGVVIGAPRSSPARSAGG